MPDWFIVMNERNIKFKSIRITDREAIHLVHRRAEREGRSWANAAAITIKEMLGETNISQVNDNVNREVEQ